MELMSPNDLRRLVLMAVLACPALQSVAAPATRANPRPLPSHPGNIFLAGERVVVPAPAGDAETWRLFNYESQTVADGRVENGRAVLGQLPAGYYELSHGIANT